MALFFEDNLAHSNDAAFLVESKFVKGGFLGNFATETALATAFTGVGQQSGTLIDMGLEQGSTAYIENYDSSGSGIFVVLVDASLADVAYDGTSSSGWQNFREFIGAGDPNGNIDSVAFLDEATAANQPVTSAGGLKGGRNAGGNTIQLGVNYGANGDTENVILASGEDSSAKTTVASLNSLKFLYDDGGLVQHITGANLFNWATNLGGVSVDGGATATDIDFNSAGSGLTSTESPSGVYTITADVVGVVAGTGTSVTENAGTFTINADVSNIIDGKGTKVTTQGTDTIVNVNYQTGATNFIATHQTVPTGNQVSGLGGAGLNNYDFLVNEVSSNTVLRVGLDELGFASNFDTTFAANYGVTIDDTDMADIEIGLEHGTNSFLQRVPTASTVADTITNIDSAFLAFHSTYDSGAVKVLFSDLPFLKGIDVDAIDTVNDQAKRYLVLRENASDANSTTADNLEMDLLDLYYMPSATSGEGTLHAPNVEIAGNLTVIGDVIQYSSTEVTFEDEMLLLSVARDATTGDVAPNQSAAASLKAGLTTVLSTDATGAITNQAVFFYDHASDTYKFKNKASNAAGASYDNVKALTVGKADSVSGSANNTTTRSLAAVSKSTVTVTSGGASADDPIVGGGTYKVTHNLNTTDVMVMVQKTSDAGVALATPIPIFVNYDSSNVDFVNISFSATQNGDVYQVYVVG